MSDKQKYIEALKKRALGYEYEEVQTLIEETAHGTKKKIVKTKKHVPADVSTARWLLSQLDPTIKDFEDILNDFEKELKAINGDSKKKDK